MACYAPVAGTEHCGQMETRVCFFSKGRAVEDLEALKHLEIKGDT